MLSKLPPRERQIVNLLYERGDMSVADLCETLPGQPSGGAVRTMLKRLEEKGFVQRTDSPRGNLYSPALSDADARKNVLSEIVRVFFNGSPAVAASALLGMSDRLDESEIDEIEAMIAKARDAKGAS